MGVREKVLEKIELLRQRMVVIGLEHGLDHPDVLDCSRQIDELHNELLRLDTLIAQNQNGKKPYRLFVLEKHANFA